MANFRWVETPEGVRKPVNLDRVLYARAFDGITRLVFGAMPGGFDEVQVTGTLDQAFDRLIKGEDWPIRAPDSKPGKRKLQRVIL